MSGAAEKRNDISPQSNSPYEKLSIPSKKKIMHKILVDPKKILPPSLYIKLDLMK